MPTILVFPHHCSPLILHPLLFTLHPVCCMFHFTIHPSLSTLHISSFNPQLLNRSQSLTKLNTKAKHFLYVSNFRWWVLRGSRCWKPLDRKYMAWCMSVKRAKASLRDEADRPHSSFFYFNLLYFSSLFSDRSLPQILDFYDWYVIIKAWWKAYKASFEYNKAYIWEYFCLALRVVE